MKSFVLTVLASLMIAGAAVADPGGEGNNQGCNGAGNEGSPCAEGGAGGSSTVDNTNVNTNVATAVQSQEQGQFQAQGNSQKLTIEDAKNPASSSANLYLANCTSGASGQGFGGGGAIGGPDEVCLLLNYAQVAQVVMGNPEQAAWAMHEAQNILKIRTNSFLRLFQALPIVRRIF